MQSRFVKIITVVAVMAVLVLGATLALAQEATPKAVTDTKKEHAYVGTKSCKMCHNTEAQGKIFDKWMSTGHAKSMAVLDSAKGETTNPKCLKCHTTGYGMATGYDKAADMKAPDALGAVGCEACHGPGADYKAMGTMKNHEAAIAAGLIIPTEEVCKKCHNQESPTFKGFDYTTMYPKIKHAKKAPGDAGTTGGTK